MPSVLRFEPDYLLPTDRERISFGNRPIGKFRVSEHRRAEYLMSLGKRQHLRKLWLEAYRHHHVSRPARP